jgi:hydrogenase expression/formation protein HypC
VKPGDRVLVHAGCIIQKVTAKEAEEMEELMRDLEAFDAD